MIIKYNSNFIGLKFTAAGVFVSVLEQRAGADLDGRGWHPGGPFNDRGGMHKDTVALTALPAAVTTFFSTAYPTDTLLHASITPDSTYVLISKNKVLYATAITAKGKLIKRNQLEQHGGTVTAVTQANLLAAISTYLTATYPAYVFDKAYSLSFSSTVQGYAVLITANSTKYVIEFSATGAFIKAIVVH
ncbi:hypothetical protein [Mucilaginibacter sp.]|uniref:hypothetical protein n=1 Tax=Mucilaginibacter sp. TaxID=1882438 RepID=UPI003D11C8B8